MSGSYPDMAADWTQMLPNHDDTSGYHETSGTSFATPRTAGILSLVLTMLREDVGDMGSGASSERGSLLVNGTNLGISNSDLRDALNLSAWHSILFDMGSINWDIAYISSCTYTSWLGCC